MYTLICDGKTIGQADSFQAAMVLAQRESCVDKGACYKGKKGRIVSVWSGPIKKGCGVTKHVSYACGSQW